MKHKLLPALLLFTPGLFAQNLHPFQVRDTLLQANSQGSILLLEFPSGDDTDWVNYDYDGMPQTCYFNDPTFGWYIAPDAGEDEQTTDNFAFTSCSWLNESGQIDPCDPENQNRNWLITPPIHLDGSHADLDWKSLSKYGPAFMDGYIVLASTTTNLIEAFTDTLFQAAQIIKQINDPTYKSLDPADYLYTAGYIHANAYTDTSYFFKKYDPPTFSFYLNGRFEPHHVDLSVYLNKTVYIAFLHNSDCDYLVQIDDILITDDSIVAVRDPSTVRKLVVFPNPTTGPTSFKFAMTVPQTVGFSLTNALGQTIWTGTDMKAGNEETRIQNDFGWLQAGVYYLVLQTEHGLATRKLIKQ